MKKGNKNLILFSIVFVLIIGIIYMWNINMGKTSRQVKETISFLEELSENVVSIPYYDFDRTKNCKDIKINIEDDTTKDENNNENNNTSSTTNSTTTPTTENTKKTTETTKK